MGTVLITLKLMPQGIDVDLSSLEGQVKEKISGFGGEVEKMEQEPVAFGIKALKVMFSLDENKGSIDNLEKDIKSIEGIQSVDVVDMRRAFG